MSKIIIANFKMELDLKQSLKLIENYKKIFLTHKIKYKIIVCPDFLSLAYLSAKKQEKRTFPFHLASQTIGHLKYGALTGEVSPLSLKNIGVNYSLIGHSERRQMGEKNSLINKKIKMALKAKIVPIVCLGSEKKLTKNTLHKFITNELKEILVNLSKSKIKKIIIAYEPVWAISPNEPCSPKIASQVHSFIKDYFNNKYKINICLLYGGSVNDINAKDYLAYDNIDGLLVGNASLSALKFKKIIS